MAVGSHFDKIKNLLESGAVEDITSDTRKIKKGSLFFLLPRAEKKIEEYFDQSKKAVAFVHSVSDYKDWGCFVKDVESVFVSSLKEFYKESYQNLKIYGITGTNGKTTTAYMLKHLLESYGVETGLYGTVQNSFKENILDTGLTSPTAEDFYRFNHQNYQKGMRAVVCEVSSHALDQKRLGVGFLDGAGFTSFSQDHLDYHGDMKSYLEAKLKIKTESLKSSGVLVLSKSVDPLVQNKSHTVSLGDDFDFKITDRTDQGSWIEFRKKDQMVSGLLPLYGDFNVENFSLALTLLCKHFGGDFFPDKRVFRDFFQIPGRMEKIDLKNGSLAFIDYSHTPDSLEKALETLQTFSNCQKIISVFGCGGDRDKSKRPLMGKVSDQLADCTIITSDNPRSENPLSIIEDIKKGVHGAHFIEPDRAKAIYKARELSESEASVVLIAGKGHESTQETMGVKKHFSDKDEVLRFIDHSN